MTETNFSSERANSPRPANRIEIVDAPSRVTRMLGLLPDGRPYLATFLTVRITIAEKRENGTAVPIDPPQVEHRQELALLVRELDGSVNVYGKMGKPIPPEWELQLRYQPAGALLLSSAGYKAAVAKGAAVPSPRELFQLLVRVFDTFAEMAPTPEGQRAACELLALYAMATWVNDSFNAFPYLWPNGDKGSGKTKVLVLLSRVSYLGHLILAGGSYAAIRDLAEYGATLCFDDAENLDARTADPDKRALLLAGNRKGAFVPVKEANGQRSWVIRNVSAYCPKAFSAIRMPDPVLARRTIVLPMVRSADEVRANRDALEDHAWPCDHRKLLDDLWAFGLYWMPAAKAAYETERNGSLTGPAFEPWRPIFAVARLVEEDGEAGLVARARKVALDYQQERVDFEASDITRLAVRAVAELVGLDTRTGSDASDTSNSESGVVTFTAQQVSKIVNRLAEEEELSQGADEYTNPTRVGRVLDRLRIKKSRDLDSKRTRRREITREQVSRLLRAYTPQNEVSEASDTVRASELPVRDERASKTLARLLEARAFDDWSEDFELPSGCVEASFLRREGARALPDMLGSNGPLWHARAVGIIEYVGKRLGVYD